MTDLLLLGILIMQVIIFHNYASGSGRYMKLYDILSHRLPKHLGRKTVVLSKAGYSKGKIGVQKVKDTGKLNYHRVKAHYQKVRDKIKGVKLWQKQ